MNEILEKIESEMNVPRNARSDAIIEQLVKRLVESLDGGYEFQREIGFIPVKVDLIDACNDAIHLQLPETNDLQGLQFIIVNELNMRLAAYYRHRLQLLPRGQMIH